VFGDEYRSHNAREQTDEMHERESRTR
jgi:hypothetical protein